MFSHFTLGTNDLERAQVFYMAVMQVLGQSLLHSDYNDGYLMFAPPDRCHRGHHLAHHDRPR